MLPAGLDAAGIVECRVFWAVSTGNRPAAHEPGSVNALCQAAVGLADLDPALTQPTACGPASLPTPISVGPPDRAMTPGTPAPHQNEFLHQIIEIARTRASEMDVELR